MCHLTVCLSTLGFPSSLLYLLFPYFFPKSAGCIPKLYKHNIIFQSPTREACISPSPRRVPLPVQYETSVLQTETCMPNSAMRRPVWVNRKDIVGICKIRAWMIDTECSLGVPCVPIQILCSAEFAQGGIIREANSKHCCFYWGKYKTKWCLASGGIRSWVSIATIHDQTLRGTFLTASMLVPCHCTWVHYWFFTPEIIKIPQTNPSRKIAYRVAREVKGVLPFDLAEHPNGIVGK